MHKHSDKHLSAPLRAMRLLAVAVLIAVAGCASTPAPDVSGMSFSAEPLLGKVVWNDLITEDIDAARRFYGGVFGWTFEETKAFGGRYVLARSGNVFVAGFVPVAKPVDGSNWSRWLPYMSVADVDTAVTRATGAGAIVAVAPRETGLGRAAAIIDPEGAVIGLARSKIGDPDDATTKPAAGRVVWTELLTDKAPADAASFYRTVVGFEVRTVERRGGEYTKLVMGGTDRAGILRNPTEGGKPVWLTYFGVADPAASATRAEALGGRILLPVSQDVREGTMAVVTDPAGAILVLQKL